MTGSRRVQRRTVLKALAGASVGLGSTAIKGFPTVWSQETSEIVLRQIGSGTQTSPFNEPQIREDLGFAVRMELTNPGYVITKALDQPAEVDIVDVTHFSVPRLWPSRNMQAIDANKIERWAGVSNVFKTGKYNSSAMPSQGLRPNRVQFVESPQSKTFALHETSWLTILPTAQSAESIAYNAAMVGPIRSWADVVSSDVQGQVVLSAGPTTGFLTSALALQAQERVHYEDVGFPSGAEVEGTFTALRDLKNEGQFAGAWLTFGESVNWMLSGKGTVFPDMFPQAVTTIRAQGVNARIGEPREGNRSWTRGLMLMDHLEGPKLDAAYKYLNWQFKGFAGAQLTRAGFYSPVQETARQHLTSTEAAFWLDGKASEGDIPGYRQGSVREGGSESARLGNVAAFDTQFHEQQANVSRQWADLVASI